MKGKKRGIRGHYIGLEPQKHTSLASYHCRTCNASFTSSEGLRVFCPDCGSVARPERSKVSAAHFDDAFLMTVCQCDSPIYTNMQPHEVVEGTFYCPLCGGNLAEGNFGDEDYLDNDEYTDTEPYDEGYTDDSGMYEDEMIDTEVMDETIPPIEDEMIDTEIEPEYIDDEPTIDTEIDEGLEDYTDIPENTIIDEDEEIENLDLLDQEPSVMAKVIASDDEDTEGDEEDTGDTEEGDEGDEDTEGDEEEDTEEDDKAEAMTKHINSILAVPLQDREHIRFDTWKVGGSIVRNVIVSGFPVARIHLEDQEDPERIARIFPEQVYEETVLDQMERKPIREVLQAVHARFINTAESKQVPVAKQVKAKVDKELNAFRTRFKETFLAVLSGSNKNLFPDVTNVLKQNFWTALAEQGIQEPEKIIEPVFKESSMPYLDQVFDKTIDLLNKDEKVRLEILQMVEDSGTVAIANNNDESEPVEKDDFEKRLVEASFPFSTGKATPISTRNQLRQRLRLGR